jgi:hypothetical protein
LRVAPSPRGDRPTTTTLFGLLIAELSLCGFARGTGVIGFVQCGRSESEPHAGEPVA